MENDTTTIQEPASNVIAALNDQAEPGILDTTLVSYSPEIYQTQTSLKSLGWVISEIRTSPELQKQVQTIRAESDPVKRRELKERNLPYFVFSHFNDNQRLKAEFKSTKFILIDLDHLGERLTELVAKFRADRRIFLFFVSPSGDGLKVAFALNEYITDNETYERVYRRFQEWLRKWYGVQPDSSTIDSSRACFLSADPDLYVNWNAEQFDIPVREAGEVTVHIEKSGNNEILAIMRGVEEPGRHLATTRLAAFYKNKGMDYSATLATMMPWNRLNKPPLDDAELEETLRNVFKRENYGTRDWIPPKERKMWTGEELADYAESNPLKELVEGVLSDEGVYMLAGQDKSGKSLLAMNLALSVAGSKDTFLSWKIMKHGPVVYFNNELSERQMGRRIACMGGRSKSDVHYMNDKDLRFDENIEQILEFCRTYNPVLVVVDCHYRTSTADKDYGNAIQEVLENYTRIKEEMKCCVFVIHHTRKSAVGQRADSSQAMGSHTFAMMTDGNFQLKRSDTDPNKRILFETGSRDFTGFAPRLIELNPLGFLWFRDLGECNESDHTLEMGKMKKKNIGQYPLKVLEETNGPLMKQDLVKNIREKYGVSQATAYRSLGEAFGAGKIAESSRHVVTLVGTETEPPPPAPVGEEVPIEEPEVPLEQ